jgi:hypothetical protein
MRKIICWIAALLIGGSSFAAYGQEVNVALQQKLNSQFTLTQVTKTTGELGATGTGVVLQKVNLVMYSIASPLPPANTYKNGKISQGAGGFGRDLLITTANMGGGTSDDYPHKTFSVGDKFWVILLKVEKTDVVFRLLSDPYDGLRYYGELKIQFDKAITTDQAIAKISEVLTVDGAPPPTTTASASASGPNSSASAPTPSPINLPAGYVNAQNPGDQLQLNPDKSFSLEEGGQAYHGTFAVNDNKVDFTIIENGAKITVTWQDNTLVDPNGMSWVLRGQPASTQSSPAPSAPPGTLQNDGVIKLVQAGFGDEIIIAKIKNSKCQFDTSTEALIQLKKSGVSSDVLKAMITAGQ